MFSIDKILPVSIWRKVAFHTSRKTRIVSASALVLAACAFGAAGVAPMAPDASDIPVKSITQELALPDLAKQISVLEQTDQSYLSEEKVRPGDTLAALLNRLGIDDDAAAEFIKSDPLARSILQLKVGKRVQAQTGDDGELKWISTMVVDGRDSQVKNIVVTRDGDHFKAVEAPGTLETRVEMRSGEIKSSLFAATDAAQIPDTVASQIVDTDNRSVSTAAKVRAAMPCTPTMPLPATVTTVWLGSCASAFTG